MLYIFLAVITQLIVALAQLVLKMGAVRVDLKKPLVHTFKNKYLIASIILFLLVPLLSIIAMRVMGFSNFYSFTALGYFFIMLFSWTILKEDIDRFRIIGNLLVIAGVIVFNL